MRTLATVVASADSVDRPGVQAQYLQGLYGAGNGPDGRAQGAAQHAHDGGGLQAVADDVADGDGVAVGRQIDHVVPVAAHVERSVGRQVAHGDLPVPVQVGRAEHDLLEGDGDLAFTGMRLAQPLVQLFQIVRPGVHLGCDPCRLVAQRRGDLPDDRGMHQLGDVVGPRDDPFNGAVRPQDGAGHPAPPSLLDLARPARDGNVEAPRGHHVGLAGVQHALE
jgi:hypothetical protein